ncbi:MAG: chromosome segregation protein SMC, partial [Puniceicoccales bacterium]
ERLNKAREDMVDAEKKIADGKETISQLEEAIRKFQLERDAHKDGLAEVRLDLAEKKQRLELYEQGLRDAESQRRELSTRILRRRQEIDSLTEQLAGLKKDIAENTERAAELDKTLTSTSGNLAKLRERASELEKQLAEAEKHLGAARSNQREHEGQLNQFEVKLAEERSQSNFLADKVQSEYEREIAEIDWKQELWHADEEFETKLKLDELGEEDDGELKPKAKNDRGDPTEEDLAAMDETDWPEIEKEVKYLRQRIHSLGAVNLVAIEEYAELSERFEFLKTQSEDLWKSKDELLKAIDEINETSQKMFQETFEQIRKNFIFTFEKLFGGGKADLALVEAEDVLDSGIEITARPPGTKLKSLSLLSGGQRTMTAVALLFAIYMVKPSPFAVLDELDAPLDDVNIGRFTDMVREFVRYSQFLIVTHNKRTVSTANAIYGVTMQERGVTKLVSMRFNKKGDELLSEGDAQVQLEPAGTSA